MLLFQLGDNNISVLNITFRIEAKKKGGARCLYGKNIKKTLAETFTSGVTDAMMPAMGSWLYELGSSTYFDGIKVVEETKNRLRLDYPIQYKRPYNSLEAEPAWVFTNYMLVIASNDPEIYFTVLDYLMPRIPSYLAQKLEMLLSDANHVYAVRDVDGKYEITERIKPEEHSIFNQVSSGKNAYNGDFKHAFEDLYGVKGDSNSSAFHSFRALESALKFHAPYDIGPNLGAMLGWFKDNAQKWHYTNPTKGQTNSEDQFLELLRFVNNSYRSVKHGQKNEIIDVNKQHAGTILRAVGMAIYELETSISFKK